MAPEAEAVEAAGPETVPQPPLPSLLLLLPQLLLSPSLLVWASAQLLV